MIEIRNLVKRYGDHLAVDHLNLTLEMGKVYGFLGPNGAGKSTTMNIMTGYLSATEGDVVVNGHSILDEPEEAKACIGYLPEQPPLYMDMTVEEYLAFCAQLKKVPLEQQEHQLREVIAMTQLEPVQSRLIGNLSKGYRQRVGIAAALIGNPPVLIFDEPTVGLDPKQIIEVRNLLRTLGQKHTVILSTHILPEVQAVCERIIVINRGHIIANERTADMTRVIEDGKRYRVKICGPAKEVLPALKALPGVGGVEQLSQRDGDATAYHVDSRSGSDIRKAVFFLCSERGWPMISFEPVGMDLEEIFLRLVDRAADKPAKTGKAGR